MTEALTVMGAGGKMGLRITDQLKADSAYDLRCVEPAEDGRAALRERGIEPQSQAEALAGADSVIMAVPDRLMGSICAEIVDDLEPGTMVMLLDPAAAYAGVLPEREDITYFLSHPCHPPLFHDETDPDAQADLFGGQGLAKQHIVCALHQGPEEEYARGKQIARDIYAPVMNAYRVTTEQMAILEPTLVETVAATLIYAMREGLDRAVELGVPEEAAREFLYGHIRIETGVIFGEAGFPLSDAAEAAVEEAMDEIFVDDWADRVFDLEKIHESAADIATPD